MRRTIHFWFIVVAPIVLGFNLAGFSQNTSGRVVDTSFTIAGTYCKLVKQYPQISLVEISPPPEMMVKKNIVYAPYAQRPLCLDIFYSQMDEGQKAPCIVMIHGGGWRTGERGMEHQMAIELAKSGFICATVEYRLSPEAKYPAAIYDLKNAIRWLLKNAAEYRIDTNRIAAYGCSAGGELAAFLGVTGNSEKFSDSNLYPDHSARIQAVVDIDGILDFTDPAESGKDTLENKPSAGKQWFGAAYKDAPQLWKEASPLHYVDELTPPTLFINSSLVRFHAGRGEFTAKLKQFGTYYEVHTLPDTPHPFWLFNPWFKPVSELIVQFLTRIYQ